MDASNTSGITCTSDKVLLKPVEIETKTESGLVIPDDAKKREDMASCHGILVDAGPIALESHELAGVKMGDIVIFTKHAGFQYTAKDGVKYRILRVSDIIGKTDGVYEPVYRTNVKSGY
jgi:chaperonin GroES